MRTAHAAESHEPWPSSVPPLSVDGLRAVARHELASLNPPEDSDQRSIAQQLLDAFTFLLQSGVSRHQLGSVPISTAPSRPLCLLFRRPFTAVAPSRPQSARLSSRDKQSPSRARSRGRQQTRASRRRGPSSSTSSCPARRRARGPLLRVAGALAPPLPNASHLSPFLPQRPALLPRLALVRPASARRRRPRRHRGLALLLAGPRAKHPPGCARGRALPRPRDRFRGARSCGRRPPAVRGPRAHFSDVGARACRPARAALPLRPGRLALRNRLRAAGAGLTLVLRRPRGRAAAGGRNGAGRPKPAPRAPADVDAARQPRAHSRSSPRRSCQRSRSAATASGSRCSAGAAALTSRARGRPSTAAESQCTRTWSRRSLSTSRPRKGY